MENHLDEYQKELWLSTLWTEIPYLTLDTETTGFGPDDRICEVAFCVAQNGEVVRRFQSYVNPTIHIPEDATRVHGITNEKVRDAPLFEQILDEALSFLCMDIPWVAHNLRFDIGMLLKEIPSKRWPHGIPTLCTLDFAKYRHESLKQRRKGHKLHDLADYYLVKYDAKDLHGALYDAEILAQVVPKLMGGRIVGYNFTRMSETWLAAKEKG